VVDGRKRLLLCLLGAVMLARPAPGGAAPSEAVRRATGHFETGKGHYHLGDYQSAIREFTAAYALSPQPEFLFNLGQAYRQLGENSRAREMYERFLKEAPPNHPARPTVRGLLNELPEKDATPPPETPSAKPAAPITVTQTPAPAPAPAPSAHGSRSLVVVLAVTAAVLAVAGVAIGLAIALPRDPTPNGGTIVFAQ
jgi:tetratricopeptide (TPR) repeat protein